MTESCFFNVETSNFLQHIAVFFEVVAIYLLYRDRRIFDSDKGRIARISMMTHGLAPKKDRSIEFRVAVAVGLVAVGMEIYQLLSQYNHFVCR